MHDAGTESQSAHPDHEDSQVASAEMGDSCGALDERGCLQVAGDVGGCIAIIGDRYSEERDCVESTFVACVGSCVDGAAMTFMRDDDGALWRFPSTCAPDSWHVFQSADDASLGVFEGVVQCSER